MSVCFLVLLAGVVSLLSGCLRSPFICSWPVDAPRITQDFGCWSCTVAGKYHAGMDLTSALEPVGTAHARVFAAAGGEVVLAHRSCPTEPEPTCGDGLGNHLVIGHDGGYSTLYAHLARVTVREGERVERGALLGIMGRSGNASGVHLHFGLLDFTPAALSDIGPRYTDSLPEESGHLDPKSSLHQRIVEITAHGAPVRERPASYHIPSPDTITTLDLGQHFVSLAQYGDWHYLQLPSRQGPSAPPWSAGAVYGWVESAREVSLQGQAALCTVVGQGNDFAPVRSGGGDAYPELTRVWSGQRIVVDTEAGAVGCGGKGWCRLDLPAGMGGREGWVYRGYLWP